MKKFFAVLIACALTMGCGGEPDHTTLEFYEGPEKCVPGEHKACWCDGVTGFQQCREDGMAFMHCQCPPKVEEPVEDAGTEAPEEAGADVGVNLLRVWLADEPQGGEVRPGEKNVPVLGLNLQALQTPGDVNIRVISLGCRASLNGQEYADTDCWRRVREIEVLDEDGRQIAPPDSPDMVAGKVYLLVDYTVKRGETRNLLVRASFNDEASTEEPYDRVSFDLVPTINADQGIETDGTTVVVGHGFGLGQQGDEPKVEFKIVPEDDTECTTDDDCAQFNTACMTFGCLQGLCFETEDTCAGTSAEYCELMTGIMVYGYYGCCGTFSKGDVTQLKTGDLIKASGSGNYQVYYYGSNGKRYLFPSSVELDSWYAPLNMNGVPVHDSNGVCNNVLEIPEAQLVQIPTGGNVTKRPGAYSTGIYVDMQRYVVDHYRILRPVSQAVLDEIYDGPMQEHDFITPDMFFVNYVMGSPLTNANEFDHLVKYNTAMIEVELGIKSCYPGTYVYCECGDGTPSQTLCNVSYEPLDCVCN
ncbi:MAG: hypothetical protein BWY14_00024 [Parcubacteria group bacterium ADurb.Bin192]|nr:MAG: hypothetical protein BWY14_00024 [Parcubacteria group bacterium ADurb.Bin192]